MDVLNSLIDSAIDQQIFPGIEILVAKGEAVHLHQAWGHEHAQPNAPLLQTGSVFDIASLTKPLSTTLCLMRLLERGLVHLEAPAKHFFDAFNHPKKRGITLRHLLTHSSGLPDWIDLTDCSSREEALHKVLHTPLVCPPNTKMIYSDLGFIILGEVLTQLSGQPLQALFQQEVANPLSLTQIGFFPEQNHWQAPILPTLFCSLRQQWLQGQVHDKNAHILGGAAGHAGLFGTATAIHQLVAALLGDAPVLFTKGTRALMFHNHNASSVAPRGLGWDIKPQQGYASCGDLFPSGSVGHTAFTGPSLWIDPTTGWTIIVLAHRVACDEWRNQSAMINLRPKLHNVLRSIFC